MTDATADAAAAAAAPPQQQQQQLLYHEAQESRLCAVHCINSVLQGPYYSEIELAALANQLDEQEERVMLESGLGLHSPAYLRFMAEGSANVAADGNFSIQVLKSALQVWNLQCVSLESPEAQDARAQPHLQAAFICHLQAHWFAIRKVASEWYNFNSLYPAPEHLSPFYLAAFLDTLKGDGWSIFVVLGQLPGQFPGGTAEGSGGSFGRWLTPDQAQQIVAAAKAAAQEREQQQERAREQQQGGGVSMASVPPKTLLTHSLPLPSLPVSGTHRGLPVIMRARTKRADTLLRKSRKIKSWQQQSPPVSALHSLRVAQRTPLLSTRMRLLLPRLLRSLSTPLVQVIFGALSDNWTAFGPSFEHESTPVKTVASFQGRLPTSS